MGVHPDFRQRGIGSQLLRQALALARGIGVERVELEVFASNLAAKKLYERAGFKVEGTQKPAGRLDGDYDDLLELTLFLDTVTP
jgi:ribosomal protein S18 acetylase RimI-like enzyme